MICRRFLESHRPVLETTSLGEDERFQNQVKIEKDWFDEKSLDEDKLRVVLRGRGGPPRAVQRALQRHLQRGEAVLCLLSQRRVKNVAMFEGPESYTRRAGQRRLEDKAEGSISRETSSPFVSG